MEEAQAQAEAAHRAYLLHRAQQEEQDAPLAAMDLYLQVLQQFPGSSEGEKAREMLLALAHRWEAQGRAYSALQLLKRLREALEPGETSM